MLVAFFLVIDIGVVIFIITTVADQPSFHAAYAVGISYFFALILYPFFVQVPPSEYLLRGRVPGVARIIAGGLLLFLAGWGFVGEAVAVLRGTLRGYVFEGNVFFIGMSAMGALFVLSGKKRLRVTFPSAEFARTRAYWEKRARVTYFLAFFVIGVSVFAAYNLLSSAWFALPLGIGLGVGILVLERRSRRKARVCVRCGKYVPTNATICPFCGRPFP